MTDKYELKPVTDNSMRIIYAVIILLGVLWVGMTIGKGRTVSPVPANSPTGYNVKEATPTLIPEPTEIKITADIFKDSYMEGCTSEGKNPESEPYCNCNYEYMLDKLGQDGVIAEAIEYSKTSKITDTMSEAIKECLPLYK